MRSFVSIWAPIVIAITILCGLVGVVTEQVYRSILDDPQVQLAYDAAASISKGSSVKSVIPARRVDMAASLAPFIIVYSATGTPVMGNGYLDGMLPTPPMGVFDEASIRHDNRVTWKARTGVRVAIVVVATHNGGYVLVGRNMKELESRIGDLRSIVFSGWVCIACVTLLAALLLRSAKK